jgi:uroporphyrinogen decarboxylase
MEFAKRLDLDLICLETRYDKLTLNLHLPDPALADWIDIEEWTKKTDLFVFALLDGGFSHGIKRWGFERFLLMLTRTAPEIAPFLEKVEGFNAALARRAADRGASGIVIADDIAFNRGPLVQPEILRRFLFPSLARQTEMFRHAGLHVLFHSDGNLHSLMEDIVLTGVDGLHCIEETAGMDLAVVKRQYGSRLCLWGNLNPALLVGSQNPEDVTAKVRRILKAGSPGGGFIFGTSSGLFKAMNPELLELAYKTVRRFTPSEVDSS